MSITDLPLDGLIVLDLSQYLAGPLVGLKLADMGARVIKVERPEIGDPTRYIYLSDKNINGTNTLFHAINRNKESYSLDFKSSDGANKIRGLIEQSDVLIQNFRPQVAERLGLKYDSVCKINKNIIYASISGYGTAKSWEHLPGQDLLAQAKSGVMWLNGNAEDAPVPIGLSVADILAGHNALQGILSALIKRFRKNSGALIETSLIESILDLQFEVLTTYLNDGNKPPQRSSTGNAHSYLAAPYGIYETSDGYIGIAMIPVDRLGALLGSHELSKYTDKDKWFELRDYIKGIIAKIIKTKPTDYWMKIFTSEDIWASEVLDWEALFSTSAFEQLDFIQEILINHDHSIFTTRNPVRIDGMVLKNNAPAPEIGEHNQHIDKEFNL